MTAFTGIWMRGSSPYSFHILDRVGQDIYPAAVMEYSGPESLVYLRNYPVSTRIRHITTK